MRPEVYEHLIVKVAEFGIRNVRFHTYGEPLLHPQLILFIRRATGLGLKVWISTNGSLLDESRGRELLETGVGLVRFSAEGGTRQTYEKLRAGGDWQRLLTNMKTFRQLRDSRRAATRIGLNTVLMRSTINEYELIRQVFEPLVDEITFSPLEALGGAGQALSFAERIEEQSPGRRIPCRLLWDMITISVHGKVTLCCADVESEVVVGDALEERLSDLWNSSRFRRLRQLHQQGRFGEISPCKACSFGETNTAVNRFRYALLNDRASYGGRVR